jgi:hypothetical protein
MTGPQMEALSDAIRSAFDLASFDRMLRFRLDRRREEQVGPGDLQSIIFGVIEVADRQGWLADFIRAAYGFNPGNPLLKRFVEENTDLAPGLETIRTGIAAEADASDRATDVPRWLTGSWRGIWGWRGHKREAILRMGVSGGQLAAMDVCYEKSGAKTVVEQQLLIRVNGDEVYLNAIGYRFREKGNAVGWHLDTFKLKATADKNQLAGTKVDKRLVSVAVHFDRERSDI